jgi:Cu(I)/Ag(I) efflux system membrane protein CusA/SilA
MFAGAVLAGSRIGSEFMPPLHEGDLLFMPIADPSISLEENTRNAQHQNQALMQFPEVEYAVAKVARAETSTDPSPLNMTETIVHLKPPDQWRPGMTLTRLRSEMDRAVQFHGRRISDDADHQPHRHAVYRIRSVWRESLRRRLLTHSD